MIKDTHLRYVFIPLLGLTLPLVSGVVQLSQLNTALTIAAFSWFILTSFIIWFSSHWMHGKIRSMYPPLSNPFKKIGTMCIADSLLGGFIGTLSAVAWSQFSSTTIPWHSGGRFVLLCALAVIVFTLIYEILFLSRERELDNKMVKKLGHERNKAELQALTHELDPHFIFNSLNTLNYLILNQPEQAHRFNNRLAMVYKYFLVNRAKELITLEEEFEFLQNYFFLLQIRHDNKLELVADLGENYSAIKIPPCALQILLENAIKHNEFTDDNPLTIRIVMNGHFLKISNNVKPKPYSVNSTRIGLRNLSSRYRIICSKEIIVEQSRENYTVKLPLIR
jgi:sensor histidine kinase YesM